jgi:hypothetical protein
VEEEKEVERRRGQGTRAVKKKCRWKSIRDKVQQQTLYRVCSNYMSTSRFKPFPFFYTCSVYLCILCSHANRLQVLHMYIYAYAYQQVRAYPQHKAHANAHTRLAPVQDILVHEATQEFRRRARLGALSSARKRVPFFLGYDNGRNYFHLRYY